ncbi:MAG TPA: ABC transporter permease [Acidimicrobiales bacterium]|nr:ABC transporter permease [Acidimicrobiales bacterium]
MGDAPVTATLVRPPEARPPDGGRPARRAVVRWGRRLFRREWRQQVLVLALLTVAVAATVFGLAFATNAEPPASTTVSLPSSSASMDADVAAVRAAFPGGVVFAHRRVPVPGSVVTVDLRASDRPAAPGVRLVEGRWPAGPSEVALTRRVAHLFGTGLGGTWAGAGAGRRVVGLVEDPRDLDDPFALVAPGQVDRPDRVSVSVAGVLGEDRLHALHLPGKPLQVAGVSAASRAAVAAAVLTLASVALLFVGLVGVAGFTVMAQRRRRALGVLGAIGATDRHVRLVMLAGGAAAGITAAVAGTAVGLAGWLAFAPVLERLAAHRVGRLDLPWAAVAGAGGLAVVTALAASWWPAREAARTSVVAALSGRPPRPRPAGHFAAAGAPALAAGVALLAAADRRSAPMTAAGAVATVVGVLLLVPLSIRALAAAGRRAPITVRLALRDLARYQVRSGAALGAATLAVAIAASIAVSAAAPKGPPHQANMAADRLVAYAAPEARFLVPELPPDQLATGRAAVGAIAARLGGDVVELDRAVSPSAPVVPAPGVTGKDPAALVKVEHQGAGTRVSVEAPLYVATPALLAQYGVDPALVDPAADVVTSRTDLAGLQLGFGPRQQVAHPVVQQLAGLPAGFAEPNTLITGKAMASLGLVPVATAWLVHPAHPLTTAQVDAARSVAASAGLSVETRDSERSQAELGRRATAAGILLALGVLAMTAGLIRAETANDLRVLTAAGAGSRHRRSLAASTTGALAVLAAVLGVAAVYLAMAAYHHGDLDALRRPPLADLAVLVAGLPVLATAAGSLLAGREPPALARRPLE